MFNISVTDKLSPTAANQLEKHLDSDEEAFWADQPQAARMALPDVREAEKFIKALSETAEQ